MTRRLTTRSSALGQHLVVEEEVAKLAYRDGAYHSRIRRHLRNMGSEPVTQYLIRIAVDRYPGDPERSNRLYREDPLTWEEIGLSATCGEEPMTWRVKHDRDAFKELWLLFENQDGRFPLYPGESTWIDYVYERLVAQVGSVVGTCHPAADPSAEHDCYLPGQAATGRLGNHDVDGG